MSIPLSSIIKNNIAKPTNCCPLMYNFDGLNTVANAFCFAQRFKAPKDFYGYDIVIPNLGPNATVVSVATGKTTGLVGSYSMQSPVVPTINGAAITSKALTPGSAYEPSILISDVITVCGVAQDVVEVRVNISALTGNVYSKLAATDNSDVLQSGFYNSVSCDPTGLSGDGITGNPASNCVAADKYSLISNCFVRFYSKSVTYPVLHCGDSLCKGEAGNIGGYGKYAPLWLASQIDTRIAPLIFGIGGQSASIFLNKIEVLAEKLQPSIAILPPYSPNDTMDKTYSSRVMRAAYKMKAMGIIPAITTPIPWSYTSANLAQWQELRSDIVEIASSLRIPLVDLATVLESETIPGELKTEYKGSSTGGAEKHPNELGKIAEANEIVRALSSVIV